MTIHDQIRDEKLQYDINRKAYKGEEILPSNQKQMVEQAKFTYSPLGKAFEKQIKTIEDQREKRIKAIQNQRQPKTIKKYDDDDNDDDDDDDEDSPLISKQKEIFNELADKKHNEKTKLDQKVNRDDLIHRYKGRTPDEKTDKYNNALDLIDKIKHGEIKLAEAEDEQINFKSSLAETKKGNNKKDQRSKKTHSAILTCFTKQETKLLSFLMIMLQ